MAAKREAALRLFGHACLFLGLCLAPAALAQNDGRAVENVTVTGAKAAPEKILHDFIKSYTAPSPASGKIARWHGGICPGVAGLPPAWAGAVAARLRDVATQIGAPVAGKDCRINIDIVFTKNPQTLLDGVRQTKPFLLGYHDLAREKDLATVRYPVQAWYLTQTVDAKGGVYVDEKLHTEFSSIHFTAAHVEAWSGTHLADDKRSEILHVLVVVDLGKVDGIRLSAVIDDVAMMALAQTAAFDACQPVASIANLTAPGCDGLKTDALSGNDLAYLKALYSIEPRDSLIQQRSQMAQAMKKSLEAR